MWKKTKLDHDQLRKEIQEMSVRSKLYKLLEDELGKLGHWKQLPRGKPGFKNSKPLSAKADSFSLPSPNEGGREVRVVYETPTTNISRSDSISG